MSFRLGPGLLPGAMLVFRSVTLSEIEGKPFEVVVTQLNPISLNPSFAPKPRHKLLELSPQNQEV